MRASGACPACGAGPAVEIDQRGELARFAADDGHHQRQPEQTRPDERLGCAADPDPDRQRVLRRPRVDALAGERRPMPARPRHVRRVPDLQEQVQLLGEQRVVVREVQAEQREGLGEGAAPDDQVDATFGDQVQRGELLKDPHRVGGAEHGHRTAQPDPGGPRCRRAQDHRRRGVVVLLAVVFADAERVQPGGVGERDLLQQVFDALLCPDLASGLRVGHC